MGTAYMASAWVVVKSQKSTYRTYPTGHHAEDQPMIQGARIVKVTAKKPNALGDDEIAFPLELMVDEDWFLSPTPAVKVDLGSPAAPPPVVTKVDHVTRAKGQSAAVKAIKP